MNQIKHRSSWSRTLKVLNSGIFDEAVLDAVNRNSHGAATPVIRNVVYALGKGPDLTTNDVLKILKRLEGEGRVRRCDTMYQRMIVWAPAVVRQQETDYGRSIAM